MENNAEQPQLGEKRRGREIGRAAKNNLFIWQACTECGKPRWVIMADPHQLCHHCAGRHNGALVFHKSGELNPSWKGGRRINKSGYVEILLQPDDFFFPMVNISTHYVREHRLVVAKALGRNLHAWEIVHHKGARYLMGSPEDKQDNRYPENLTLDTAGNHNGITQMKRKLDWAIGKITILKMENTALKKRLVI